MDCSARAGQRLNLSVSNQLSVSTVHQPIRIFIGYDPRERAATNVLIDSLYQHSSVPLAITPLVTPQLENQGLFHRERDPKQSTAFSFTRFLVPYLMGYQGWALFMDCDMLCRADIKALWDQRDDRFSAMCVQHEHVPGETVKFLGEVQSAYPKKNWSSLMLLNCSRCTNLTLDYVNTASGLELHRFHWLEGDHEIGAIEGGCATPSRTGGGGADVALDPRRPLVSRTAHDGRPSGGSMVCCP